MMLDFENMNFVVKVFWKIRLWLMDHRPSLIETHWNILEPSYYYTHTEEECQKEKQRRVNEIMRIIEELE